MMNETALCRNCHSPGVIETPNGTLAPFFVLRVVGRMSVRVESLYEVLLRCASSKRSRARRYLGRILLFLISLVPRLRASIQAFRPNAEVSLGVPIRVCRDCMFVGPSQVYPFHQLIGLYRDYRSESYNADRCSVEPGYEGIQRFVGKSQDEIDARMANLDGIIDGFVAIDEVRTVLDWGGGEGRFVPTNLRCKNVTVLDCSTERLVDSSFLRIDRLGVDQKFDYVQICHVLEHVSEPRSLMLEAVSHVRDGGYIYIEVPQDRSDEDLQKFLSHPSEVSHSIHEHLNLYSRTALERIGQSCGLRSVHISCRQLHFGWVTGTIISGLFIKDH